MRKLILALVTQLLAITVFGDPFAALYAPADFTLYHPGSQQIDITPLTSYTVYDTNIVTHQVRHFSTGTRITATGNVINGVPGSLIVSNMIPGDYKVDIFALGIPQPVASFTNSFTNGTPAYVNAKDFIAVSTNSVNGSGYAYTIAQMNAILANLPGGGGGGSGDVSGPSASTVGELPYFDLTTGKHLGRSGVQYTNIAFQTSLNAVSNSFTTLSNNFVGTSNTVSAATNNLTTVSNSVNAVSTFAIGVSNKWYSGSNDLRTAINNIGNANIPATWSLTTNSSGTLLLSNTTGVVAFAVPTNGLPVTTNYAALSTNFTWSQGQIAVFSGSTNSDGSPVFVPTNMPTGGGGGTIAGMITSNYLAQTTNAFVWDLSQVQRQVIQFNTNINAVVFSNAWALTNRENEWHTWEDTNGTWSISSLKVNGGLVRTNGAFWRGTNANQYDMATLRLDGTGTNVIVTFGATNIQPAISFTNSLAGGGGGGGGSYTYFFTENFEGSQSGPGGSDYDNSGWTSFSGTPDPTYSTSGLGLEGSRCVHLVNAGLDKTGFNKSDLYGFFKFRIINNNPSIGTRGMILGYNSTTKLQVGIDSSRHLVVYHGGASQATIATISDGTTYNVWFEYHKGTGSNGAASAAFSTSSTKPTSGTQYCAVSTGDATVNIVEFVIDGDGGGAAADCAVDMFRLSDSNIGDNPN